MLRFSLSMILLIALASPIMAEEPTACSLLTSGDIEAVTGGTVSATEPMKLDDIPSDHNRTVTVVGCLWGLAHQTGQLSLTWFRGPLTDEEIGQLLTVSRNSMGIDNMKSANYREISKEFPNAWCSTFSPPASDKLGRLLSACTGVVKRHGLSIAFGSPSKLLTVDQAKILLDKAGERAR